MVSVCLVTKAVNLQAIEGKSADAVIDGVNRLSCEVGMPSLILIDQDSGIMKAFNEAEVNMKDIDLILFKENKIRFRTCPVSGHNMNGLAERKIGSVSESLKATGILKMRLHATGFQTVLKLIKNDLNNLPFGYSYGRSQENSPMLKLIFPNLLRIGRNNTRALDGPITMPKNPGQLMDKIIGAYESFFEVWNTSFIPKTIKASKWSAGRSEPLLVGDTVYFKKIENDISSSWTVGKVITIKLGRDGTPRRAEVKYHNLGDFFAKITDRAARSLVKLSNVEDSTRNEDMVEVKKVTKALKEDKTHII